MKVLIVQHESFEKEGNMADWLEKNQAEITYLKLYEEQNFPNPADFDLIILVGGPMSVNDEAEYPWLVTEKEFVRQVLKLEIPMLGICLGGQLIANALGAEITLNKEAEIGWFDIENVAKQEDVFQFPDKVEIFHWHGETFALPDGAVPLIKSEACENQGFQYGRYVIGLQCHPEATTEVIQEWLDQTGGQMAQGNYIQTAEQMLDDVDGKIARSQQLAGAMLDYITAEKR